MHTKLIEEELMLSQYAQQPILDCTKKSKSV